MAWTDGMIEELKKLWKQGITTGEIGRRLGISKNSIVGKVHRLGLEGRPSPIKKGGEDDNAAPSKNKVSKVKSDKTDKKTLKENRKVAKSEKTSKDKTTATKAKASKDTEKGLKKGSVSKDKDADIALKPSQLELKIEPAQPNLVNEVKSEKVYKGNISLTELDNHTCRWPIGDPKDEDFCFCGCKVKTGQTYCEEHAAIAYVKPVRK